jgi:hypothetical protein
MVIGALRHARIEAGRGPQHSAEERAAVQRIAVVLGGL